MSPYFITLLVYLMFVHVTFNKNFMLHPCSFACSLIFSALLSLFSSVCFYFSLFPAFLSLFPPIYPPSHSYLRFSADLLLLRWTCQDHRDQFSTTEQHLSSYCIRHGSERPLSSCLLFAVDGRSCVHVCSCVCGLCL